MVDIKMKERDPQLDYMFFETSALTGDNLEKFKKKFGMCEPQHNLQNETVTKLLTSIMHFIVNFWHLHGLCKLLSEHLCMCFRYHCYAQWGLQCMMNVQR